VTGLPVVVPQGLTKEQEEQYLRKFVYCMCHLHIFALFTTICMIVCFSGSLLS